tara:strand:- start:2302 stop:2505 length:204 start_codon:yes stop_codon:yes gene_type:complete
MLMMDTDGESDFLFDLDIPDETFLIEPPFDPDDNSSHDVFKDSPYYEYTEIYEEWVSEDEDDPTFIP